MNQLSVNDNDNNFDFDVTNTIDSFKLKAKITDQTGNDGNVERMLK